MKYFMYTKIFCWMEHCHINRFTEERRILIVDLSNVVQTSQSKSPFRAGTINAIFISDCYDDIFNM